MIAIGLGLLAFASSPPSGAPPPAEWAEVRLGTIPEELSVATDLLPRSNRFAFDARESIEWSADGRTVAYAARRGDQWLPVVGDRVGEAFDLVSRPKLAGDRAVFRVGRAASAGTQTDWLWIDGELVGPEDRIAGFALRPDGRQIAYWTQPGARYGNAVPGTNSSTHYLAVATENQRGAWSVAKGEKWWSCSEVDPVYSADGKAVFSSASERGQAWRVLRTSGKREAPVSEKFPAIEGFSIADDGGAIALVRTIHVSDPAPFPAESDQPQLFFKGRRIGRAHARVSAPVVDARGERVAYVIGKGAKRTVAVGDEKDPPGTYDFVQSIAFDPTGARLAFIANHGGQTDALQPGVVTGGQWLVVVRAVEGAAAPVEIPAGLEARDLAWDASGERLAFAARDDAGWRIVCGSARSPAHTDVGRPHFSPEGRAIGFGSRDGRELWWRVLPVP